MIIFGRKVTKTEKQHNLTSLFFDIQRSNLYRTNITLMSPVSLWIDADPSGMVRTGLDCDDDLAILMALQLSDADRKNLKLVGISTCGGNAPVAQTLENMNLLLQHASEKVWDVQSGIGWRSMNVVWQPFKFLKKILPERYVDAPDSDAAAYAIIDAAQRLPPKSLTVLMLGPPSNLARAFKIASWLPLHLKEVVLMGGELTHQRMDLNFNSDRSAARAIVQSGAKTTIVPVQTCGQISVTQPVLDNFFKKCCPQAAACALYPKMRQQVRLMPRFVNGVVQKRFSISTSSTANVMHMHAQPSSSLNHGFVPWDIVALLVVVRPELFAHVTWHRAEFPPCHASGEFEPCDGTMLVYESNRNISTLEDYQGWVQIPHLVQNETEFLDIAFQELLCGLPAQSPHNPPPKLLWGFTFVLLGLAGIAICVIVLVGRTGWLVGSRIISPKTKAKQK